jgi:hypothetical protein
MRIISRKEENRMNPVCVSKRRKNVPVTAAIKIAFPKKTFVKIFSAVKTDRIELVIIKAITTRNISDEKIILLGR